MSEIATLVKRVYENGSWNETKREVFCAVRSIGQTEFYQSNATEYRPALKLIISDYLDYNAEQLVDYNGRRFRVIRSYRTGREVELTLEGASLEEGDNREKYN